ncbi:MAG: sodium ion-translocating decarboxylase subunit beta, partial [Spirochaetaceae bacterium]|nr:sodium ion-translocating decarboxylase subunit beta [Spirochaetaceae bacterium]
MTDLKKNPVLVTKICIALVIGAFVFSFMPRALAQSQAASDDLPSFRNLGGKIPNSADLPRVSPGSFLRNIAETTGIYAFINDKADMKTPAGLPITVFGWQELLMVAVGFLIIYLGAVRNFEPLLLIPIGFGTVFVNIPFAGMGHAPHGMLHIIYESGVGNEFFPMIIFMGIGAMTDFGPLIANPKTALLGAAAQFGVFGTLFGISLANYLPGVAFNLKEACSVAIIGGADGPTTIYIAAKLA